MKSHELLELFRSIAEQVTEKPVPAVTPETPIADIGIDSAAFAEIVARVEDQLEIEVPATQWMRVRTLEEFVRAVDGARGK